MEVIQNLGQYVLWFLIVLTVVVFIHELGHFAVARLCGVRVEIFSIGFGRELFGHTSRSGTRWKFSLIPLGGYVKFFGDSGVASETNQALAQQMTEAERAVSFHHKALPQRSAIVAAGPIANFLLAMVILTGMFVTVGRPFTPPVVGTVVEDSAAAAAGIQVGDRVVGIDDTEIERFEQIREIVAFSADTSLLLTIERDGETITMTAAPRVSEFTDGMGNVHRIGLLGIGVAGREYVRLMIGPALVAAVEDTYTLVKRTLQGLGQIIVGARSAQELGGPLLIAQMSAERAADGLLPLLEFVVVLSATLGLINLFPIPVLDGGHLFFYTIEAVRGRPLGERAQEYGYFVGLAMVLSLMVFATVNDLTRPAVIQFFTDLIG
ncbi:MAG: RIP metalloprotease RseP [Alphaproteobacteria bacterium]|jgi:regulator of sigma E protease|nr:RIP metalloprotease RseP [Alphaproteobacteria bacterium]MDP6515700.1 RIP metalloprotease RseP [Alphaproteobacteria bacterium]